jgi:hypothetical protein
MKFFETICINLKQILFVDDEPTGSRRLLCIQQRSIYSKESVNPTFALFCSVVDNNEDFDDVDVIDLSS